MASGTMTQSQHMSAYLKLITNKIIHKHTIKYDATDYDKNKL